MREQDHILLTGGTGFFGKALLRHWATVEKVGLTVPNVTVLSRDPDLFSNKYPELVEHRWVHMHRGDVCVARSLPISESFSHVIHAAADSTLGPKLSPFQRYDQIINGTRNMLDFAVACRANHFLFTSSGAVYGSQPPHMDSIPESWHGMPDPLNPANAYGVAKRTAEHLCALYSEIHGLRVVIARCFAFVGPDLPLDVHFAIGNFIRDALWRDEITVAGDGTSLRSYLDQQDLAHWLLTILEKGEAGEAYNVGSDQAISILDLAKLISSIIAAGKPVRINGNSIGQPNRNIYIPNIQKATEKLGLGIRVPLNEAITKMVEKINIIQANN